MTVTLYVNICKLHANELVNDSVLLGKTMFCGNVKGGFEPAARRHGGAEAGLSLKGRVCVSEDRRQEDTSKPCSLFISSTVSVKLSKSCKNVTQVKFSCPIYNQ